jgi:hypothetical protein
MESEISVAHHWGVCINTVRSRRGALGVPKTNAVTHQLMRKIALSRTDDRLERARIKSKIGGQPDRLIPLAQIRLLAAF